MNGKKNQQQILITKLEISMVFITKKYKKVSRNS